MILSDKFSVALLYALEVHRTQERKTSGAPYFAHLLGVASTVLEYGGSEEFAIAALLHDAVEDQGGVARASEISVIFGKEVGDIVMDCSDAHETPKPPWKDRKLKHIDTMRHASLGVLSVTAADKLYNARMTLDDLRYYKEKTWEKFKGGKEGTLWYYQEMIAAVWKRCSDYGVNAYWILRIVEELRRVVDEMEKLANEPPRN